MILYIRITIFLILWAFILFFNVKAILYNKEQEYSVIWSRKDIRPYVVLRIIRFILLIFTILLLLKKRNIIDNIWFNIPKNILNEVDEEDKNNENNNKNNDKEDSLKSWNKIHEIIVNDSIISQLTGNNIKYIPITDGYYKIITDDNNIISKNLAIWNYKIPKPSINKYCSIDEKFWNIFWNWVDYNWFIYDYINWKNKEKVLVAIIDSWIDTDNKTLAWHIAKNTNEKNDWIDNDWDWYIDNINWINVENKNWIIEDELWHWTHVAWIILQTFPNAEILPIKVSNWEWENVSELSLIEGIRYAIDHNVDIINLSLWSEKGSELEHTIIKEATNNWILVIAAAGNEWMDSMLYYPAWYEEVISVWSIWNWGKQSDFSNLNATAYLPWECIYSYWIDEPWVFMDWTSMSTPHLAGLFWTYKSLWNNIWTWAEIQSIINKSTRKLWESNVLQISKLLWIEKENNKLYENIWNINKSLKEISKKLENINYNNLSSKDISWIISYSKWLSTNWNNIKKIYNDLWLTWWFWTKFSEWINSFVNKLNSIDQNNLYLSVEGWNLKESLWVHTCASDYDTVCNTFSRIIEWGSKLPASNNSSYYTMNDNQTEVKFDVYQWENNNVDYNRKLWTFTLSWLPKKPKWEAWATVYFNVDENWKLTANAVDLDNAFNSTSPITLNIQREQTVITWENYDKVVKTLRELLQLSNSVLWEIDSFYKITPFDYIPENINWVLPESTNKFSEELTINNAEKVKDNPIEYDIEENIKVAKVIDWDTIKVVVNWTTQNVRLIWVDSPENSDTRFWYTECYWEEASNYLSKLLKNKYIWLIYDKSQWTYDAYDRLLAYVIFSWENINQKIIENWYWREYTFDMPYKYQKEFKNAEKSAKEKWLGLWNINTCWWKRIAN